MLGRATILTLTIALAASATTLEKLSMDEMIARSTAIVRAKAVASAGEVKSGMIFTRYRLQVSETLKGTAAAQVDVWVPGGTANRMRQVIPGAPVLEANQDYLVFLWTGSSGRSQIIGLSQGLFNLVREESGAMQLERLGAKEMVVDPQTGRAVLDATIRMPIGEMKTRVVTKLMELQSEQAK